MFATYKRIAHANRIPGTGTAKVVNPNPNLPRLFICSALHGLQATFGLIYVGRQQTRGY